jgi:hypothetical protein
MSQTYRIGSLSFTGSVISTTSSLEHGNSVFVIGLYSHAEGINTFAKYNNEEIQWLK